MPNAAALARLITLRESIASTALSHEADCDCRVCRASKGDERAMAEIMAELQEIEL